MVPITLWACAHVLWSCVHGLWMDVKVHIQDMCNQRRRGHFEELWCQKRYVFSQIAQYLGEIAQILIT